MTDTREITKMGSAAEAGRVAGRGWMDRPSLDWLVVAVTVFVVLRFTPLLDLWVATDKEGQRSAMSSVSSIMANVAAFGVAGLFAFSALENPTSRMMRIRWGSYLTGSFLRSVGLLFGAALVCGVAAVSVNNRAGAIAFLIAGVIGLVKFGRLLLTVASLLKGQDDDARRAAITTPKVRRSQD